MRKKAAITDRYSLCRSLKTQKTENQPHYFYLPPSTPLPLASSPPYKPISRNSSWSLVPVHALTRSPFFPPPLLPAPVVTLPLSSSADTRPIVVRKRGISNSFSFFFHVNYILPFRAWRGKERTIERREKAKAVEIESTNRRLRISRKARKVEDCYEGTVVAWQDPFQPNRKTQSVGKSTEKGKKTAEDSLFACRSDDSAYAKDRIIDTSMRSFQRWWKTCSRWDVNRRCSINLTKGSRKDNLALEYLAT